jgi:UDP-3-O-[3-hydroxymyristoyl] glucosamine N-acyltransferase
VDGVTVTAMTLVNQDIRKPGVYSSGTGMSETGLWKRNVVRFRELDAMAKKLKTLSSDQDGH